MRAPRGKPDTQCFTARQGQHPASNAPSPPNPPGCASSRLRPRSPPCCNAGVVPPLRRSTSIARHSNGHRVPNYRRCSITAPLGLGPLLVSQPSPSTAGDSSAQCTACTSATVASAAATCISSRDFSSTQPASASPVQSAPQSPPHLLPDCTAVAADASTIVCLGSPHVRPCPERMSPHGNGALPIFCAPAETAAGLHLAAGAGLDDTCDDPCSRAPPPPPLLDEVRLCLHGASAMEWHPVTAMSHVGAALSVCRTAAAPPRSRMRSHSRSCSFTMYQDPAAYVRQHLRCSVRYQRSLVPFAHSHLNTPARMLTHSPQQTTLSTAIPPLLGSTTATPPFPGGAAVGAGHELLAV